MCEEEAAEVRRGAHVHSIFRQHLESLRAAEQHAIIRTIAADEPLTVSVIAERTGMHDATVRRKIPDMLEAGLIVKRDVGKTSLYYVAPYSGGDRA